MTYSQTSAVVTAASLFLSLMTLSPISSGADIADSKSFATLPLSDKEKSYWQESMRFREQEEADELHPKETNQDGAPEMMQSNLRLNKLESRMHEIIGPVTIDGEPQRGELTLKEMSFPFGWYLVDGLKFKYDRTSTIVTTLPILQTYLRELAKLPTNMTALAKNTKFYSNAWSTDSTIYRFSEVEVTPNVDQDMAYAFIGVTTMDDIGPYTPNELYTFVIKGNRLYLTETILNGAVKEIPKCRSMWINYFNNDPKTRSAYLAYNASAAKKLPLEQYIETVRGFNEWISNAYLRCYASETPKQPYYPTLQKMAQSIVDKI